MSIFTVATVFLDWPQGSADGGCHGAGADGAGGRLPPAGSHPVAAARHEAGGAPHLSRPLLTVLRAVHYAAAGDGPAGGLRRRLVRHAPAARHLDLALVRLGRGRPSISGSVLWNTMLRSRCSPRSFRWRWRYPPAGRSRGYRLPLHRLLIGPILFPRMIPEITFASASPSCSTCCISQHAGGDRAGPRDPGRAVCGAGADQHVRGNGRSG